MAFGQYLLEQNILNETKLLEAYIELEKKQMSLLQSLNNCGLPASQTLEVIHQSIDNKVSIAHILSETKPDILQTIIDREDQLNIGHIIVSNGLLSEDKLNNLLKDYQSIATDADVTSKNLEDSSTQEFQLPDGISAAALESLREQIEEGLLDSSALTELGIPEDYFENLASNDNVDVAEDENSSQVANQNDEGIQNIELQAAEIDKDFIEQFINIFDSQSILKISNLINQSKSSSGEEQKQSLTELIKNLHMIKGVTTLINANISTFILESLEDKIEKLISSDVDINTDYFEHFTKLLESLIFLKNSIEREKSEEAFIKDQKQYEQTIKSLKML